MDKYKCIVLYVYACVHTLRVTCPATTIISSLVGKLAVNSDHQPWYRDIIVELHMISWYKKFPRFEPYLIHFWWYHVHRYGKRRTNGQTNKLAGRECNVVTSVKTSKPRPRPTAWCFHLVNLMPSPEPLTFDPKSFMITVLPLSRNVGMQRTPSLLRCAMHTLLTPTYFPTSVRVVLKSISAPQFTVWLLIYVARYLFINTVCCQK